MPGKAARHGMSCSRFGIFRQPEIHLLLERVHFRHLHGQPVAQPAQQVLSSVLRPENQAGIKSASGGFSLASRLTSMIEKPRMFPCSSTRSITASLFVSA
jgi:hypothetical protein